MKHLFGGNPWRYGWVLFGLAFLAMYIPLYWGLINYWHDWFGGWTYYVPQVTSNPDAAISIANSLSQFVASTCSLLLGVLGCAMAILKPFEKEPSLALAKWMGLLLCMYLGSVLIVVASELMDPLFRFFRWFCLWVPTSFALYLLPFWVYYSESRYPKRYSPLVISFAHVGLAIIPFGLLIFFAFSTYYNLVGIIQ